MASLSSQCHVRLRCLPLPLLGARRTQATSDDSLNDAVGGVSPLTQGMVQGEVWLVSWEGLRESPLPRRRECDCPVRTGGRPSPCGVGEVCRPQVAGGSLLMVPCPPEP